MTLSKLRDKLEVVSLTIGIMTALVLSSVYGSRWFDKTEAHGAQITDHEIRLRSLEKRWERIEENTEIIKRHVLRDKK